TFMVHQTVRNNPYTFSNHADSDSIFHGRKLELEQLQAILHQQQESSRPILLLGSQAIGKTSILKQIESGFFGDAYNPIYIDLKELALDSINSFCWDLAHKTSLKLAAQHIEIPEFNQTAFIAAPLQAFQMQILQPAMHETKSLLFLFDNLDDVIAQIKKEKLPSDLIQTLHAQIRETNKGATIFALTWEEKYGQLEKSLPYLKIADIQDVGPLSKDDAFALLTQPVTYTLVRDVADYIYEITNGYPTEIHTICHALFEHHQKYGLVHITVADVAMAHKQIIENIDVETAVSATRPIYSIQPNPTLKQTIQQVNKSASLIKQPLFYGFLILLIIVGTISIPQFFSQRNNQIAAAEIAATNTAVPTESSNANSQIETGESQQTAPSVVTATPPSSNSTETPSVPTPTTTSTATPTATPTFTVTPDAYPELITRSQDGMQMIYIPAKSFQMGSNEGDFLSAPDEQPQHEVTLDAFYIDKFEVNIEQYAAFLNRLGGYQRACENVDCTLPSRLAGYTSYLIEQDLGDGTLQYIPTTGFANYPANHISWHGANAYCQSMGSRLPTEAEWEYAARGTDGRMYPWGNTAPDETVAIFQSNSYDNMKPVDALPAGASPFGVYSMAGSLWEWTADWYNETYYNESPNTNPLGPETGFAKAVRGGAWPFNNQAEKLRTTNRFSLSPGFISSTVGFRCAKNP
ncbi:MAG: SUMF1/EgtB/PvdO family nonheme iron enzyme, partial [Chloroflexi bacterium]|nr:SUMF1/EgtB/PvdO family nonheme iron enzyme [Chloroflexota bacterium]